MARHAQLVSQPASPLVRARYRVRQLDAQRAFHEQVLGLEPIERAEDELGLAPAGGSFRIELVEDPDAVERPRPSVGLFHLAYRVPDRAALAETILHVRDSQARIEGAADHGVSEAVYLSDAEGNGIEIYRDRPREAWPTRGEQVAMGTDPLDVDELLTHADGPAPPPAGTAIGHIHLHVPDLGDAETFFADGLGLPVRQRGFPGALFFGQDGYHHHVGTNTWAEGRRAPSNAIGLLSYTWSGEAEAVAERFREQGRVVERRAGELAVEDPAGIELRVRE